MTQINLICGAVIIALVILAAVNLPPKKYEVFSTRSGDFILMPDESGEIRIYELRELAKAQ